MLSQQHTQCKHKIVKITNLLVSTVTKNSGNCKLIGRVGCYGYACNYNPNCNSNSLILSNRCTKKQNKCFN